MKGPAVVASLYLALFATHLLAAMAIRCGLHGAWQLSLLAAGTYAALAVTQIVVPH